MEQKWIGFIAVIILLVLASATIGAFLGHVDYNYEVNKCQNLKGSNYEFTHDVQLNVKYTEHCFYIRSHPFAYFYSILLLMLLTMLVTTAIIIGPMMIWAVGIEGGY